MDIQQQQQQQPQQASYTQNNSRVVINIYNNNITRIRTPTQCNNYNNCTIYSHHQSALPPMHQMNPALAAPHGVVSMNPPGALVFAPYPGFYGYLPHPQNVINVANAAYHRHAMNINSNGNENSNSFDSQLQSVQPLQQQQQQQQQQAHPVQQQFQAVQQGPHSQHLHHQSQSSHPQFVNGENMSENNGCETARLASYRLKMNQFLSDIDRLVEGSTIDDNTVSAILDKHFRNAILSGIKEIPVTLNEKKEQLEHKDSNQDSNVPSSSISFNNCQIDMHNMCIKNETTSQPGAANSGYNINGSQNVNVSNFSSRSINSVVSRRGSTHTNNNGSMTFNDSVNQQPQGNKEQKDSSLNSYTNTSVTDNEKKSQDNEFSLNESVGNNSDININFLALLPDEKLNSMCFNDDGKNENASNSPTSKKLFRVNSFKRDIYYNNNNNNNKFLIRSKKLFSLQKQQEKYVQEKFLRQAFGFSRSCNCWDCFFKQCKNDIIDYGNNNNYNGKDNSNINHNRNNLTGNNSSGSGSGNSSGSSSSSNNNNKNDY